MADVKEAMEVLGAAKVVLGDLVAAKSDDGKISALEALRIAVGRAPEAVKAFMGVDQIVAELKDLNSEEAKMLASESIVVAQLAFKLAGI